MASLKGMLGRIRGAASVKRRGPVGLEFALNAMHLVQLEERVDGSVGVRARTSLDYPGNRDEVMASPKLARTLIQQAMKAGDFAGSRVVSCMPPKHTRILSVTYRVSGDEDDGQAILELMRDRLDGKLEDYVLDYLPVRAKPGDGERLAVVAVAPREPVIALLELLRNAGLEVEALEIGPSAIKRLVSTLCAGARPENVMVINFGHALSYLTVLSGRRLLFDQQMSFGEEGMLEQIATALDMSPDLARSAMQRYGLDAQFSDSNPELSRGGIETSQTLLEITKPKFVGLVEEINRALVYAASETRGEPVHRIFLVGSIARWRGVERVLQRMVGIPVEKIPDPISAFGSASGEAGAAEAPPRPELAVATGLALRGMTQHG